MCWIIVCGHLWFGNVLFLVSLITNVCSWVIIHAQNSWVLPHVFNGPFLFFWRVKQVCIYKFTFIFLQLEEDSGALNAHRSWVPIQLLNERTWKELWLYEARWFYFFRTVAWHCLEWQAYLEWRHSWGQWEVLVDSNCLLSMLPLKLAR